MNTGMEVAVSQLIYHCGRSVSLYNKAIDMAGKANLADIFRALKKRRLKLLRSIRQEGVEYKGGASAVQTDNLTDLLSEIRSNEERLVECSSKILKNRQLKSLRFKEFIKSAVSEIRSSIHWLDVISSYYYKKN